MVNRRGRLTWVVYHGDRLPANGKGGLFMDERAVRLDGVRIDDLADAIMRAINDIDGDSPAGWAWSNDVGNTRLLRGSGRWWAAHKSCDEAGVARMGVDLLVVETEYQPMVKGAAIELERLGVPAGTLVHVACERPQVEAVLVDLCSRLAERWPALVGREGTLSALRRCPPRPAKPPPGAGLDAWFDWYHAMKGAGYHCTLGDVARETGYSEGHIKHEHRSYKLRCGRPLQRTH